MNLNEKVQVDSASARRALVVDGRAGSVLDRDVTGLFAGECVGRSASDPPRVHGAGDRMRLGIPVPEDQGTGRERSDDRKDDREDDESAAHTGGDHRGVELARRPAPPIHLG